MHANAILNTATGHAGYPSIQSHSGIQNSLQFVFSVANQIPSTQLVFSKEFVREKVQILAE